MDTRRFRLTMTGATPMLHNNPQTIGVDKGRDKLAWEREHMGDSLYRAQDGALIVPGPAIRKAAIDACKFITEKPKARAFKSYGPLVSAALLVEEDARLDVDVSKVAPYVAIVNLDPGKGPRGPRGPRCRPLLPLPWRAETTLLVVDDAITDAALASIYEAAGRLVGVLDGRGIGFGRFAAQVTKIA